MKIAKRIFQIAEFAVGILIALFTLFIVVTCSWQGFGFRHFTVMKPFCLIGLIFLIAALGAIGGYASYLCLKNYLNLSVLLLVVSCLLFIFFLGMPAFAYLSNGTCSQTQDIADWGSYDYGVEKILKEKPFCLFPTSGSLGTPTEYFYAYDWFLDSPELKIRASETVCDAEFQAQLQAVQNTCNAQELSHDANQITYRIEIFHYRYIIVQFDSSTLEIHYEVAYW